MAKKVLAAALSALVAFAGTASATVCGSFPANGQISCPSIVVPAGSYISATTCTELQSGAFSAANSDTLISLSNTNTASFLTATFDDAGSSNCPSNSLAAYIPPYRVSVNTAVTVLGRCVGSCAGGTVAYYVSASTAGTCAQYGTCQQCTSSACGWCRSSTGYYCTQTTQSGSCNTAGTSNGFFTTIQQCPASTTNNNNNGPVINSGGSPTSGVTAGTVIKVVDMPGSAAPIAGFVIGILSTIIFFSVVYYYQTRDERAQKAAAALQQKQLEEATKKAAESQSPNSAARLQQAVAVQAAQPAGAGTGVVSPNMVVVQPAPQPQPQVVVMAPGQPQPGMQFQPSPQPGMQFQPSPQQPQPGMQFQPSPQQPMQFQPQMQPMQPGQSGGMQFVPQQQPQMQMQFQPQPGMQFVPQQPPQA